MPDLTAALNNLAHCLADVGRDDQAPAPAEEATSRYRQLAEATPDAYLPDLAASLAGIAYAFGATSRREQAVLLAREAAAIRRRWAATAPEAQPARPRRIPEHPRHLLLGLGGPP